MEIPKLTEQDSRILTEQESRKRVLTKAVGVATLDSATLDSATFDSATFDSATLDSTSFRSGTFAQVA